MPIASAISSLVLVSMALDGVAAVASAPNAFIKSGKPSRSSLTPLITSSAICTKSLLIAKTSPTVRSLTRGLGLKVDFKVVVVEREPVPRSNCVGETSRLPQTRPARSGERDSLACLQLASMISFQVFQAFVHFPGFALNDRRRRPHSQWQETGGEYRQRHVPAT